MRRVHLIGIGGAGMSGLARVLAARGVEVSGCDRANGGHDPAHLEPGMEVVVSSAVPDELDELAAASELGLRVLHRGELLAELVAERRSICKAGFWPCRQSARRHAATHDSVCSWHERLLNR